MKNAIITGGTGFVGSWMQRIYPENVFWLWINSEGYRYYPWESHDNLDAIVHLAPIAPTRVIECARRNGARLLYASSGAVYHPENDTEYRRNKIRWEQECLDSGVDVVIARLFTFMDSSRAWKELFSMAREGKNLSVYGPDTVRSFMHGAEMARWLWAILLRGESGQAYDVGSDRAITILQLAQRIRDFTGCEIEIKEGKTEMPVYLPTNTEKTKALLHG